MNEWQVNSTNLYFCIKTEANTHDFVELFPIGKNEDSSVTLMSDERFALGKDVQTTFVDLQGRVRSRF